MTGLLKEIPLSSGNIRKLKIRTEEGICYCSIQSIMRHRGKLALVGCDALDKNIETLCRRLRRQLIWPSMEDGVPKTFIHDLRVSNFRQLKPTPKPIKTRSSKKRPIKKLKFIGLNPEDMQYLLTQLEDLYLFMTGWPLTY